MKTKITSVCATLMLAASVGLSAEEPEKPKPGSPEFERMKTLVGTWQGKTDISFDAADTITASCKAIMDGKEIPDAGPRSSNGPNLGTRSSPVALPLAAPRPKAV